jgi:hypothetical protein
MTFICKPNALSFLIAGTLAVANFAIAAPTSGEYVSDVTQSYVNDATSNGMQLVNKILCSVNATGVNLSAVLNTGNYLALIDTNKCAAGTSSANSVSSVDGVESAPNFIVVTANAVRTDNSSPLNAKIWFRTTSTSNVGMLGIISATLSATEGVTSTSPYGKFHFDFCGLADGITNCTANAGFYGYAEGNVASVTAFQTGAVSQNHQDISIKLLGTLDAGSGRVKYANVLANNGGFGSRGDWKFAYNSTNFHRADTAGTNDKCFDRSLTNAQKTAWSYGVYKADGSRFNRTSGFPIKTQSGDNGYIGYWGMWLPPSVTVSDGEIVTKFSYSNNQAVANNYTVVKKDGRLHKEDIHKTTLGAVKNVPFYVWVNQTFSDSGSTTRSSGTNLEIKWDGTNFVITGVATNNGTVTPVTSSPTIPNAQYASNGQWGWNMFGWSQSIGGGITIGFRNLTGGYSAPNDATDVTYRTQSVLQPGSSGWPTSLVCVYDCPTGGISNEAALTAASSNPFVAGTRWNWQPTLVNSAVIYTTSAGSLIDSSNTPIAWTGSAPTNSQNLQYSNGIVSGRLVSSADAGQIKCDSNGTANSNGTHYCPNRLNDAATVYFWETGPNSWNKYAGLSLGGNAVSFDPPMSLTYSVPNNGTVYAGTTLVLQYNGFGDLYGIPGKCVNPVDNSDVSCGNQSRWVSAFTIPAGGTVSDGTNTYYVKPLQQEIRLTESPGQCSALSLPTIADGDLPSVAGWTDPTAIGSTPTMPTSAAPKVIHGVLQ